MAKVEALVFQKLNEQQSKKAKEQRKMSLKIDDLEAIIAEHLEQQPWKVNCSICGMELDFKTFLDVDFDLEVSVDPCGTCHVMEEQE